MAGKSQYLPLFFCLCFMGLGSNSPVSNLSWVQNAAAQSKGTFKLRVNVELTSVEVAALDKNGSPVRNLKKEDFQLYEEGKRQEILSIDEVNADSGLSSLGASPIDENGLRQGKTVLIIFDDGSIKLEDIQPSRTSARKFVLENMRPQDIFAVATFRMSMKILQNFTSNREEVLDAIGRAPVVNGQGSLVYFEDLLRSLEAISHSIASIKGPKSILIYSQSSFSDIDRVSMSARSLAQTSGTLTDTYDRTLASARKSNTKFHIINPGGSNFATSAGISLVSLVADSGGSIIGTDIDSELNQLDKQISNYYILGFESDNPKHDGGFRKLDVRTELKGITLKHRSGYQDRRPVDVLASSRQEQTLLTALASPDSATQLPIIFRPAYFYDPPRLARVLVAAKIRMEKTVFKKKGGQLGTDLNLMGVAYAEDGSTAARFSQTLPVSIDKEKEQEFRKGSLAYQNYFRLRPGKYRLKLAVSDESNNLGSMEQNFEVPALPDRGFAGSSIILAEQASQLPDLIKNLQTQLLDETDPLLYAGVKIEPSVENKVRTGSAISLIFRLCNLSGPSDRWDVSAKARLLDEKGKEYVLGPTPLNKSMSPLGKAEAIVALNLPFKDVPPGKYRLIIEASEAASGETATLQTDLEFIK
jgi:VWFA-related protein